MNRQQINVKADLFSHVMRPLALMVAVLSVSATLHAAVILRVTHVGKDRVDVRAQNASLRALGVAIGMRMKVRVTLDLPDRSVDFTAAAETPRAALGKLAQQETLRIEEEGGEITLRDALESTVSLDVKDGDAREILQSISSQCGIRNLIIDRDVQGKGTFLFDRVPCGVAVRTVLRTLGLAGEVMPNSIMHVTQ